jgi:hypothetical protein
VDLVFGLKPNKRLIAAGAINVRLKKRESARFRVWLYLKEKQ